MSFVGQLLERRMDIGPSSTLAEPNRTILEAFGGGPVASGVRVSELIAEGIPAVYGCVDILANTLATCQLRLQRNLDNGSREDDTSHPLYHVLRDLANPEMTAFDFRTTMMRWLLLWGNAYAEVVRDARGNVRGLWPLRSDRMQVSRDNLNRLQYTYRLADGSPQVYTFDAAKPPIFHLRINSLDGVLGRSPIRVLRESIGWTLATAQFGQRFYNNNASPRGILSSPNHFSKEQRDVLRQSWNAVHQGVENAHKIAILEGGLEFKAIGMPLDDAQFIESMKFQESQIAGDIYHIPPFLLSNMEKSTSWGTGLEQQMQGFVRITLAPHFTSWKQAIGRDLLTMKSFETHSALFDTDELTSGDYKSRVEAGKLEIEAGIESPNGVRHRLGRGPRPDGHGDEFWRPLNFTTGAEPVDDPVADPPATTQPEGAAA